MEALNSLFTSLNPLSDDRQKPRRVPVKPPPPAFDFREKILPDSMAAVARSHPELLDLASDGRLILLEKRLFGPEPPWRTGFAEPEAIWLVGTSHVSAESAAEVERVVRQVSPENVVVELCRSRAGIMYMNMTEKRRSNSNMFALTGTGFLGAIGRSIDLGGQTALALRLLLALFSSKISSGIDRPFGDEFRAARRTAEEVGAQIVLGDRPIEITLERAWNSLTWTEKVSLVTSVLRGITSSSAMSQENIKESSGDDSPFKLYEKLSLSYPSLLLPLIHERDTYIAWSLKRSKAVNKSKRVVGVIGKGHMNGVIYALVSDQGDLRFRDIAAKDNLNNNNTFFFGLLKGLLRDTLIGLFLWTLYDQLLINHYITFEGFPN